MNQYWMLFVQGKDRPGIVKSITGLLYEAGANLEDISMTLIEGQFAMMLSFKSVAAATVSIKKKLPQFSKKPWNLYCNLISIQAKKNLSKKKPAQSIIISAIGRDRMGMVHRLSSELAKISANIINLDCRLLNQIRSNDFYSIALEVELAKPNDFKKVQNLIRVWQKDLGIEIRVHSSEAAVF